MLQSIQAILPESIASKMRHIPDRLWNQLEEIRIRERRPLEMVFSDHFCFLTAQGDMVYEGKLAYHPTHEDCIQFLDLISNHSLYTLEEQLRRGFITVKGGHRVGIAGTTVLEAGSVKHIKHLTSFNIRFAREVVDVARPLMSYLFDSYRKKLRHTLIISPPQFGKTTLIRDIARIVSTGAIESTRSDPMYMLKVGIVDERSEIAGCDEGVPKFDVGPRTDVLDGCPKAEGMMMLLRSMSPDVIIADEIGRPADADAILEVMNAGIQIVATAHGKDLNDISNRPVLKELLRANVFERIVILGRVRGHRSVHGILDQHGRFLAGSQFKLTASTKLHA